MLPNKSIGCMETCNRRISKPGRSQRAIHCSFHMALQYLVTNDKLDTYLLMLFLPSPTTPYPHLLPFSSLHTNILLASGSLHILFLLHGTLACLLCLANFYSTCRFQFKYHGLKEVSDLGVVPPFNATKSTCTLPLRQ